MDGLRPRAQGLLDMLIEGFRNQGQEVITPFNMSPVDRQRTPLQQAMNRPEVMLSQPGGQNMVTFDRGRTFDASPVPQVQAAVQSAAQPMSAQQLRAGMTRITPMQVATTQPESNVPVNRLIGGQQTSPGQGVMQPGMDREKMMRDAKVAKDVLETGDESLIERAKSYFGSRENMLRLAMAFNTMRLEPDQGLARALGDELKDLRAVKVADKRANATLSALRQAGVPEKDLQVLANDPELLRKYATEFFKKQLGTLPAEQQAFENLIANMSPEDQEKARRIKAGLDPRAGSQFALSLEELFARSAAQAGGSQKGKSEEERKQLQVQNDKTWNIWQKAISGLEESLGATSTGKIVGLLPAITSNQQIAEQAIAIMAPVLKNIFRESGEGVFTDKDQQILIDMIPDRTANPETIAYAIQMINDIVAAKLNQPTSAMEIPAPSGGGQVLRFDAQGNPI